jgi:hypothetical protein
MKTIMKRNHPTRRNFIQTGLLAATGLAVPQAVPGAEAGEKLVTNKFVHTVFFWLKPDLTAPQTEQFKKGLKSLTAIDTVEHAYIGVPAATNRPIIDRSYSYALMLVFKDAKGHDDYQAHPVHDDFRKTCSDLWSKVLIYDCV